MFLHGFLLTRQVVDILHNNVCTMNRCSCCGGGGGDTVVLGGPVEGEEHLLNASD